MEERTAFILQVGMNYIEELNSLQNFDGHLLYIFRAECGYNSHVCT